MAENQLPDEPITNPVDRFAHLPRYTRQFLEDLREEEIELLEGAIRMVRSFQIVGKLLKWLIWSIVGTFMVGVQFGESILKFFALLGSKG